MPWRCRQRRHSLYRSGLKDGVREGGVNWLSACQSMFAVLN